MSADNFGIKGLNNKEISESVIQYGLNVLIYKKQNSIWIACKTIIKEPMVLLLLAAASLYFFNGDFSNGIFMAVAVVLVSGISLYQNFRSQKELEKLKQYSQPKCKVIRNGETVLIKSEAVVVGDAIIAEEGGSIAADCIIIHSNDFSVNESILTGESFPVEKSSAGTDNIIYAGTTVATGLAIAKVTAIGNKTRLGEIGNSLQEIKKEKTPLETQISKFVGKMIFAGTLVFVVVWVINYLHSYSITGSLLKSLTLAMSILPEEIPVAFATFMALGASRLMKMGIIVKDIKTVETLGSSTVICIDKTGTLTENNMSLARIISAVPNKIKKPDEVLTADEKDLITLGMWASEPNPFDPMEKALHNAYSKICEKDERSFYNMVHEYPLSGKPPMMTHILERKSGERIIAAKGALEAILSVCNMPAAQSLSTESTATELSDEGYRLLGVARSSFSGADFPKTQQEIQFSFCGILAFYDPPKKNIKKVLSDFYEAGISVKIITGDNVATTTAIAREIGFHGYEKSITGDNLMALSDPDLSKQVTGLNLFARMFPDAKLRVIKALKANGEIVAMTGDGVNDGPALKAAHIGVAMGKKGTEIAKEAASLILLEDDLTKMVTAIAVGRRMYANLKKAIQYIIAIHIPIILTVFIPLAFGWLYPNIFSPLHIIFFELIMGPTCSIIYENEAMEKNTMLQKPRAASESLFSKRELMKSVIQGLAISIGTLSVYLFAIHKGYSEGLTRAMVFTTLISANIFLTLVNRSLDKPMITGNKNVLVPLIILITAAISIAMLFVPPLSRFFGFDFITAFQFFLSCIAGFICTTWYEIIKWYRRSVSR